jgi:uncharacterized membrane protein YfcA
MMSLSFYMLSSLFVFFFSGLMAMAGLGAALLFVPFFYYMGVPLGEAMPTALLLNAISLSFASVNYVRGKLVNWRIGVPILVAAVALSPLGARLTPFVNKGLLLSLFAAFLLFAGGMMLFYQPRQREQTLNSGWALATGLGVGGIAGFLGGLLGVGGGNIIVPVLNWLGLDTKIAVGTCALVVVFSSLSGFLGHVSMGGLDPMFVGLMSLMAAGGSTVGSYLMMTKVSSGHLKRVIGIVLWLIAVKMIFDLLK